jgi:Hydrazine synthase alpha subunit middle domain
MLKQLLFLFFVSTITVFGQTYPNSIIFCTQVPQPFDFTTSMSTFGNHLGSEFSAPRGGDLYIRYTDGTLKNLTQAAGYGQTGLQGATSIAVRDPDVHWDGNRVVFSMVIGSATMQYQVANYTWKIYEMTGIGQNQTPVVTLLPNQPVGYNNVQPIYGTDDRIIFTTDMPRNGQAHLYPQHDEYESSPIVSGIWKFDPKACSIASGLQMLTHSPSGDFTPTIDQAGRLIFTRWDHLKRDQQADADIVYNNPLYNGTFNYSDESSTAVKSAILPDIEVFPEPRASRTDLLNLAEWVNTNPQDFNIFNPWMMNEDGSELEMLNHLGRHDMGNYMTQNFTNDPNLHDFYTPITPNPIRAMFHIKESPVTAGLYYGIEASEFGTHGSGMVVKVDAPVGRHPEQITFNYVTHPATRFASSTPNANHTGLYRNPMPLTDGKVLVSHSPEISEDQNIGTPSSPQSKYNYRIRQLVADGTYLKASPTAFTGAGITKTVTWWSPDVLLSHSGVLWETSPVEVYVRPRPTNPTLNDEDVEPSEQALFTAAGVDLPAFRKFLKRNELSVLAIRDVTSRDDQDQQQPFNLKVAGTSHQTINPNAPNTIYEVKHLQFLQNDQIRGIGGINNPKPGRRGIAQFMHDPKALAYNPPTTGAQGSTNIHADGSAAMIVPAKRALTWQLTDANNKGIVRERLWLSTLPGEIRTCTSCHGESTLNQAGNPSPVNAPQALTSLLSYAKTVDSDNDGTKDIYDAYPNDPSKQIAEAVNEKFVNNLANWLNQNVDNDAAAWTNQNTATNANSAMINNRAGADNTGKIDRFRKLINLANFDGANLTFDVAYARYDASKYDKLRVWIVKCDGTSQMIFDKSSTTLATAPDQTTPFTPTNASQWRTETLNLSAYAGKTIELVFENVGGYGNQLFIDNILIQETAAPPPCPNTQSFSGNVLGGQYNSAQTISTQAGQATKVLIGSNVIFNGGNSISLQAGFEVQKGSVFKAMIGGCN